MSVMRVFFALWPTPAVAAELAALAQVVATATGGRAAPPGALHVTVAFVGEVPDVAVEELGRIGTGVARTAPRFTIVLDRVGFFAGARIAWAGCTSEPPVVGQIAAALREALQQGGYRTEDRSFRTHVTLARRCRTRPCAGPIRIVWQVDRMALVRSVLGGAHARYDDVVGWRLGDSAGFAV